MYNIYDIFNIYTIFNIQYIWHAHTHTHTYIHIFGIYLIYNVLDKYLLHITPNIYLIYKIFDMAGDINFNSNETYNKYNSNSIKFKYNKFANTLWII